MAQRGSAATESLTADDTDGADIMNKPKKYDGEPQIDTDETQMGKECFFDR